MSDIVVGQGHPDPRVNNRINKYKQRHNDAIPTFQRTINGINAQQKEETKLLRQRFLEPKAKKSNKKAEKKSNSTTPIQSPNSSGAKVPKRERSSEELDRATTPVPNGPESYEPPPKIPHTGTTTPPFKKKEVKNGKPSKPRALSPVEGDGEGFVDLDSCAAALEKDGASSMGLIMEGSLPQDTLEGLISDISDLNSDSDLMLGFVENSSSSSGHSSQQTPFLNIQPVAPVTPTSINTNSPRHLKMETGEYPNSAQGSSYTGPSPAAASTASPLSCSHPSQTPPYAGAHLYDPCNSPSHPTSGSSTPHPPPPYTPPPKHPNTRIPYSSPPQSINTDSPAAQTLKQMAEIHQKQMGYKSNPNQSPARSPYPDTYQAFNSPESYVQNQQSFNRNKSGDSTFPNNQSVPSNFQGSQTPSSNFQGCPPGSTGTSFSTSQNAPNFSNQQAAPNFTNNQSTTSNFQGSQSTNFPQTFTTQSSGGPNFGPNQSGPGAVPFINRNQSGDSSNFGRNQSDIVVIKQENYLHCPSSNSGYANNRQKIPKSFNSSHFNTRNPNSYSPPNQNQQQQQQHCISTINPNYKLNNNNHQINLPHSNNNIQVPVGSMGVLPHQHQNYYSNLPMDGNGGYGGDQGQTINFTQQHLRMNHQPNQQQQQQQLGRIVGINTQNPNSTNTRFQRIPTDVNVGNIPRVPMDMHHRVQFGGMCGAEGFNSGPGRPTHPHSHPQHPRMYHPQHQPQIIQRRMGPSYQNTQIDNRLSNHQHNDMNWNNRFKQPIRNTHYQQGMRPEFVDSGYMGQHSSMIGQSGPGLGGVVLKTESSEFNLDLLEGMGDEFAFDPTSNYQNILDSL